MQEIVQAVDDSIQQLFSLYKETPTLFFTENDLVCCFYRILHEKLSALNWATTLDKENKPHSLIHCEYPTPFRCEMGGSRFEVRSDGDVTPKRKLFRRGHYDLVVLNPSFIANHHYELIKAQNYQIFRAAFQSSSSQKMPAVLYGIEFVFSRDEIKLSKIGGTLPKDSSPRYTRIGTSWQQLRIVNSWPMPRCWCS